MADEKFGSLLAFSDIEDAVLAHYKLWMHTWLCARERKLSIPVNTIARPRSYIVKQTFSALPGEEQTPLVIAVCDGFAQATDRRGSGEHDAYLRFGIVTVCMGSNGASRKLCGHYQTAMLGIALRHRTAAGGLIALSEFVDLRIEDIDDEALGRSLSSVRLELVYKVQGFAGERPTPDHIVAPPIDPENPQPGDPPVESVNVTVDPYKVDEEIPRG